MSCPLNTKEEASFVCDKINDIGIDIICLLGGAMTLVHDIKSNTSCKVMYWLHTSPYNKSLYVQSSVSLLSIKYPILSVLNSWPLKSIISYYNNITQRRQYLREFKEFDIIACLCDAYADDLRKIIKNVHITSLINSIDKIPDTGMNIRKKRIVFAGRLDYHTKRLDRLIKIWSKIERDLPEWEVLVYGSGWAESLYKDMVSKYNLERFKFMGYCDDMVSVYRESEICCLTSQYEGWGMILVEAQCCGCIPIVFDSYGAVKYIIGENKEYGIRIKPFDLNLYATSLKELCCDDDLRQDIRIRLGSSVNRYSFSQNIKSWTEIKKIADSRDK